MTMKRLIPMALATVLSAPAIAAASPQQVPADPQPIDEPVVVEPEASFAPQDNPTKDGVPLVQDDEDLDRRCLQKTGSRVTADPQPATRKDQSERNGADCVIGNGTVHTRKDLERTGATNVEEALQRLDPRVF